MLIDGHGRVVDYLRISVTQRCNFRCQYCMPTTPFSWVPRENLLSFEQMFEFVKVVIDAGVKKIRITGGEPLVRKGVDDFVRMISDYAPHIDLAMTTNGYLLFDYAKKLADAGLKRINMSLDTLDPKKAQMLAQRPVLKQVLSGYESALNAGLNVKLNTVALKGINDDELVGLLEFARSNNSQIRFIEYMENLHAKGNLTGLKSDQILEIIGTKYPIKKLDKLPNSPASLYELEDSYIFGIIDPHKHDFCESCNRIRLSAEGLLIPCLYHEDARSIKSAMDAGDINGAVDVLRRVLQEKPKENKWAIGGENQVSSRAFYHTGG